MLNKVQLIGRLGKDPELKSFENDNSVCRFTLATSEKYKDKKGEKKENTEWHSIVIWGKIGEIAAKYLKKGHLVYLEGKVTTRSWEKDGEKKYTTEIVCHLMQMLEGKKEGQEAEPIQTQSDSYISDPSDDLPF